MWSGGSTIAVDTARTSERLSAFMSEVASSEPVDNISVDLPTLSEVLERKQSIDGGRQTLSALDTAFNTTVNSFSGYDTFDTTPQDTARTAVYPMINYGDTVTISWEEIRETSGSDHRIFDLLAHKRRNAIAAMKDRMNSDLFVAAPAVNDILSLPHLINTTNTVGGIDSSVAGNAYWRSQQNAAVAGFAANGMTQMRDLYNDIVRQGQGSPDLSLTTQAVFQAYEAEVEPDVRYSNPDKLGRGALELEFKGKPLMFDADMTAGELYMINFKWLKLCVDTDGNFSVDPFITPATQKISTAKVVFRGQLLTWNRRALGRLTGIT